MWNFEWGILNFLPRTKVLARNGRSGEVAYEAP